jgi:hypothetical protein
MAEEVNPSDDRPIIGAGYSAVPQHAPVAEHTRGHA